MQDGEKEGEEKKGRQEHILMTGWIWEGTSNGVLYTYNHTDLYDCMTTIFFQKKESRRET